MLTVVTGVVSVAAIAVAATVLSADQPSDEIAGGACFAEQARDNGLKAFPTAEGFGRFAVGGRAGAVYAVTTLADAGPGSLRACAEAEGPRTCVFRVSGTIAVDSWIQVKHPYLTIAGQTSPGGIALRLGESQNTPLLVQASDVIIRHLRIRPGASRQRSENVDTIQISGGAHDVILDHLSTSWPTDEGINIVGDGHLHRPCKDTRNVTVQWSILSEGLQRANRGPHSRGTYFGYGARDISFHHNLIANNYRRNPLSNGRGQFDMVNNVIFNAARYNAELYTRFGDLMVNAIGNVAIRGPAAPPATQLYMFNYFRDYPARFSIYLKDNLDWRRVGLRGDERLALDPGSWTHATASPVGPLSISPAAISSPAQGYREVMRQAGANLPRDAADVRLLGDIARCRGAIIDDPADVGGWPVLAGPPPPADRDGDGIADAWEVRHGLSPGNSADGAARGADGYTNLEVYLNELAGDGGSVAAPDLAMPDLSCGQPTPAPSLPPVVTIAGTPHAIAPGGTATLRWTSTNVKACKAFGGPVPAEGERVVRPDKTETYMIHCSGAHDSDAIDAVVVEVRPAPGGR